MFHLALQDISAQLLFGLLQFGQQSALESGNHSVFHTLQCHRWTVAGENDVTSILTQMIEDMEEGVLCGLLAHHLLDIVHDEHIYALVEMHEIVHIVLVNRRGILNLKESGTQIKHPLVGMQFLHTCTDGIYQVSLTHTAGTVYEEGIECLLTGVLGNGKSDAARQLIAGALNEIAKVLFRIETGIQILSSTSALCHTGSLVDNSGGLRLLVEW